MIDRRQWMQLALGTGVAFALRSPAVLAADPAPLLTRPIPSSGERIPVVGLGSSATFRDAAEGEDVTALREVLAAMVGRGATVFDTAPSYGASEAVAGSLARELDLTSKIFWATKVNVAPRGSGGRARADRGVLPPLRRQEDGPGPGAQPGRHPGATRHPQGTEGREARPLRRRHLDQPGAIPGTPACHAE